MTKLAGMRNLPPPTLRSDISGALALWLALSIAAVAVATLLAFFGP